MSRLPLLAIAVATLSACGVVHAEGGDGGPSGSRSFSVRGFDRVELRGSDNVIVKVGGAESVTATGPQDVLDRLEIEVVDGKLRVGREGKWHFGWSRDRGSAVVTVTLPRLRGASIAGSGDMKVDRVQATSFEGAVAGSGNLAIGTLQADAASFDIAGSGGTSLTGQAKSIEVSIAGSGSLSAQGLKAERAKISIAGSGDVRAQVSGEADVSILGSGDVELVGNPRCKVSKMGSGNVRCG
ncbi:DUF2807 domain-containing protein [Sphingomonas sp. ID1715]|uniref:head GIN domain-containing protein n=1 Tax=Sphingomonas sp. ID1715 TaxID=1656898 RepID=UPI001488C649|nr:head GIN domain-containing protein [Sphingomonas sp. ID1715]NNM76860.1 DUF2807 domain-containing protein [Sphingomonas sp. ID1715]